MSDEWISVNDELPRDCTESARIDDREYVLAIDAKNRMSVGYTRRYSTGQAWWIFAKPIGEVTHWMPLPEPPKRGQPST